MSLKKKQLHELLYQALETEQGGKQVYTTAIECARNDDLRDEWKEYLEQTTRHEQVLLEVFRAFGLDPREETPGRKVVRHMGRSLVQAMEMARADGDPAAAEIVAGECVVLAETKDHLNWKLLGLAAEELTGDEGKALREAHDEVEDQEDEHLYHSAGWTRELWIESLGLGGVLPPPEERKDVRTAIGAARAEHQRAKMS
jgi:hypothetical protein